MVSVDVADAVTTGVPFTLSWTVTNSGIGPTSVPEWADAVYLGTTADMAGAKELGRFTHVGNITPDGTYSRTVEITLPLDLVIAEPMTATRYPLRQDCCFRRAL